MEFHISIISFFKLFKTQNLPFLCHFYKKFSIKSELKPGIELEIQYVMFCLLIIARQSP